MSRAQKVSSSTTFGVKVVPRASRSEVIGWSGDILRLRVTAPPQDGRANAAVLALLAEVLGVRLGTLSIAAGHASAHKRVAVEGLSREEIERRIVIATGHGSDAAI